MKKFTDSPKREKMNLTQYYSPMISRPIINTTFIRFVLVGIVNTIIGYSLIMVFFHIFGLSYGGSYFLSYVISFVISFFLNRRFVFFSKNKKIREFIKFILSFVISYLISYIFLYIFVEYKIMNENIAFFAGMVIYSTLFYLLNKYFTFNNKRELAQ